MEDPVLLQILNELKEMNQKLAELVEHISAERKTAEVRHM